MGVPAPPFDATSDVLADWLELSCLATELGQTYVAELTAPLEIEEDFEEEDCDADERESVRILSRAVAAIQERAANIGRGYPFSIDDDANTLSLLDLSDEPSRLVYIFCLLVSHGASGGLLSGDFKPPMQQTRDLFQICATLSAAGVCSGPAYSIGFPRQDKSGFLAKLKEIYTHFGDGTPHVAVPPGAPPLVKDDGVDVVAWAHQPDRLPGRHYLLGQAASGKNWYDEKSVVVDIDAYNCTWFSDPPATQHTSATFIPFCLPLEENESLDFQTQEQARRNQTKRMNCRHGEIYYRYRIPPYIVRAFELGKHIRPVERIDEIGKIEDYCSSYRVKLIERARP